MLGALSPALRVGNPATQRPLASIIKGLFANSEQGVWYDPSDFERYMSALGPELVTNGDFSNGLSSWNNRSIGTGSATVNNGVLTLVGTDASNRGGVTQQLSGMIVGRSYKVTWVGTNTAVSSTVGIGSSDSLSPNVAAASVTANSLVFVATAVVLFFVAYTPGSAATITLDNISVRELTAIDTATLYQDAAGTIPVTAVEQPVGLMLDKSRGLVLRPERKQNFVTGLGGSATPATYDPATGIGTVTRVDLSNQSFVRITGLSSSSTYKMSISNTGAVVIIVRQLDYAGTAVASVPVGATVTLHFSGSANAVITAAGGTASFTLNSFAELPGWHAIQTTATSRPVLSARVNLLTKTEDFAHSDWPSAASFSYEAATDPNGGNTATKIVTIGAATAPARDFVSISGPIDLLIYLKSGSYVPQVLLRNRTTATALIAFSSSGTSGSNQYGSWVLTPAGDGWVKIKITLTSGFTAGNVLTLYYGATGIVSTGRFWYVWHPDIRPANSGTNLPDYQRVNTATDYDTAGFPYYLKFDGTDDWLVTPSIDFTSTDKMMVCAGVRRLADTASQMIVELGVSGESVAGSWFLAAQYSASYNLFANSLGVPANGRATAWLIGAAPTHDVVSFLSDLAGSAASDRLKFRRNGGVFAGVAAPGVAGTGGNYGNYPLYIGRRAGASLSFNGHLYGLIIRGAATSDSQIKSVEKYINGKTRAF